MQFSLESHPGRYHIDAYGPGEITITISPLHSETENTSNTTQELPPVQRETLTKSLIICPDQLIRDWPPQTIKEFNTSHHKYLLSLQPEIVILGTGAQLQLPDPAVMATLVNAGIGFEVMSTGAACRTYAILSSDGRNVVAALMMI